VLQRQLHGEKVRFDPAGADKSSAQVISLIIDPGPSAVMLRALALFTCTADWRSNSMTSSAAPK
jgi:hypothetical protein